MKHSSFKTSLAIYAIFFIMPGALIVNPAIQTIAETYSDISYTMILLVSTIPLLMIAPVSLISGAIAGNKVPYRHLLYIALTLYIVGGAMPFVFRSFIMVLVGRALFGIGVGLATPLANGLVIYLYEGKKRASMTGIGSMIINVSSTLFMLLSGYLSGINVHYIWLIHLLALLPFVLIIMFLPEVEMDKHQEKTKVKLPLSVYVISLSMILVYMNLNPMLLNMSTILTSESIGNATAAGTILSMYTIGGIVGGFIFGKLYALLGRMTIPVSMVIIASGLLIINLSSSFMIMIIGATMAGIGFFNLFPAKIMEASNRANKSASTMVSAFVLSAINIGGFLSSFYVGMIGQVAGNDGPRLPIQTGMIVIVVMAIIWTIFGLMKRQSDLSLQS